MNGSEEYDLPEEFAATNSTNTSCCNNCNCKVPSAREIWENDRRLLRVIAAIVVLLNIPYGRYILYPFMIFSTWIHESCHGMAAFLVGGKVEWLNIYENGSGLAYTMLPADSYLRFRRVVVSSAGYTGTAILGGIFLMFRRTRLGPRIGLCGLGLLLLLSCACLVRNAFGLAVLITMGLVFLICGWRLSSFWAGELFALIAASISMNAITSIDVLFGTTSQTIGGEVRSSDAVSVAEQLFLPYWVWASLWFLLALFMTALGLVCVVENGGGNSSQEEDAMLFPATDDGARMTTSSSGFIQSRSNSNAVEII
uniref:Uncharacterized protein n=1 Tax=Chaetoceros debilis TaxID=122233 RepID=A0A7S3PUK6_9STRA|mmetsp:Transcript_7037/g.10390  ORF Transcript_7037/g.10390 Transcript_7037/m.10390 type:complete len:311 (+) Transcript_7037:99-1031(+)